MKEKDITAMLRAASHPVRLSILKMLSRPVTYSDMLRQLNIDTGHLNYHLRRLKELVKKDEGGLYRLSPIGGKILCLLQSVEEGCEASSPDIRSGPLRAGGRLHILQLTISLFFLLVGLLLLAAPGGPALTIGPPEKLQYAAPMLESNFQIVKAGEGPMQLRLDIMTQPAYDFARVALGLAIVIGGVILTFILAIEYRDLRGRSWGRGSLPARTAPALAISGFDLLDAAAR